MASANEADAGTPAVGLSRFQIATAAVMLVGGAIVYPSLPATIPQHWDVYGQVDRWADKSLLTVFFPVLIVLGMVGLAWLLPRIDPLKESYARFADSYYWIIDLIVAFLAFLHGVTLYAALNSAVPVGVMVPVGVGLLLALLGNRLGKVKRNFFVGIKTPWTLASETVWVRSHRLGGRMFVAAGLGGALAAFLPAPHNFVVFIALVLTATLASMVASYVIYERLRRAGELENAVEPPPEVLDASDLEASPPGVPRG